MQTRHKLALAFAAKRAYQPWMAFRQGEAGYLADMTQLYTLHQNSDGSTDVTAAGDPIGLIDNVVNDSPDLTQPTAGSRGALAYAPAGAVRNRLTNNMMTGAVVGAPGTAPDTWIISASAGAGGTRSIPAVDLVSGKIEVRFAGTTGSTAAGTINPSSTTAIPAVLGETWTAQTIIRMSGGSTFGISSVRLQVNERDVGGSLLASTTQTIALTSSDQLVNVTRTLNNASTAFVTARIEVNPMSGVPIDMSIEVTTPQLALEASASAIQNAYSVYNITESGVPTRTCERLDVDWANYGIANFGAATAGFRATAADNWFIEGVDQTFSAADMTLAAQTNQATITDRMFQVRITNGTLQVVIHGHTNQIATGKNAGAWFYWAVRCTNGVVEAMVDRGAWQTLTVGAAAAEAVDITAWARNAPSPASIFTGYGLPRMFVDRAPANPEAYQLQASACNYMGIAA
jgi:hypothetical protein